eukprot:SM000162S02345  [mRNA]  locus=s162:687:4280:+ [translate_table: standard]
MGRAVTAVVVTVLLAACLAAGPVVDAKKHKHPVSLPAPPPPEAVPEYALSAFERMPQVEAAPSLEARAAYTSGPSIKKLGLVAPYILNQATLALNGSLFRYASVNPPLAVDWRTRNVLTAVRDQGACSSCWAHSSVDSVAAIWAIAKNVAPPNLSAQQVCDCEQGSCCQGGWPEWALQYVVENGGVQTTTAYPYVAANQTCKATNQPNGASITSWDAVPQRDAVALAKAVANQPVIVFLEASAPDFQNYTGGVYDGSCNSNLNHAVLVVGYGTDAASGKNYWLIKNSWGPAWGEGGYMRLAMYDGKGLCGITSSPPLFPVITDSVNGCNNLPNPCGIGQCIPLNSAGGYSCKCASGFVQNFATSTGQPQCVPSNPCSANPNPCGSGSCTNNGDGSYSCVCPSNYIVGAKSDGSATCVFGHGSGTQTYTTVFGDTCPSVQAAYQLSKSVFQSLNPGIQCYQADLSPAYLDPGSAVAVSSDGVTNGCASSYTVQSGDTCLYILIKTWVWPWVLLSYNPTLNCNQLFAGQQLCLSKQTISKPPPKCGQVYEVQPYQDTCAWVVQNYGLDYPTLYSLNPGLQCTPYHLPAGMSICVAADTGPVLNTLVPQVLLPNCSKTYRVQVGDSCPTIYLGANLTETQFMGLNPGLQCDSPRLQIGQPLCIAPPVSTDYINYMPYVIKRNDTLQSIAQSVASQCGPTASPANICFQNNLPDCNNLTSVVNTTIEIPCQWPVGRYCGCTPDVPVCGWDGKIYTSQCDAICNYASPTYAPTGGKCNPCAVGCAGNCFGAPSILSPAYCQLSSYWNPCPNPVWPPTTYSCTDYLVECQKCCWGLGYGSFEFNSCFSSCRNGKC